MDTEDLALWKRRLQSDRAAQVVYHPRWQQAIRLFDTTYWDALKAQNPELVEVNYSTTFITTLVSAVFSRSPKWRVEATRPGRFYRFAETMTVLMEQFKEEEHLKDLAIKVVVDAATCNIGWLEQGFFPSLDTPIPTPETGTDPVSGMRRMQQLLEKLTEKKPMTDAATQGELHQQKQPGQFYLVRRSPWDVLVPAGCYEYETLPYLIVCERMTWEDFSKHPGLKNQDRIGTLARPSTKKLDHIKSSQYNSSAMYNGKASARLRDRDPDRQVELFTVWDRREQQVFKFSESSDVLHQDPVEWPYLSEGFPQHPLQFNYVPEIPDEDDNFYGFSDLDPIIAQVLEKSELRTQQSYIRRRAPVKVFVQQGSVTESQLTKLQSPDMEIIPVMNVQSIVVSQPIQIPPAVLQTEERIDSDLSRDSNMSLLMSDAMQLGRIDRATVANYAQQGTMSKSSYKVDRIEAWIKAIGRYRIGLFWQYLSKDEVGERLGHLPSPEEWIPLPTHLGMAKRWIAKEMLLQVEVGSTKPLTVDVLERDNFMNSLAVMQQVAPGIFNQVQREMLGVLIKKFNEPALEAIVMAALDPQEQESALMENQLLDRGMPQVVGPHDDHETHLKVHGQGQGSPIRMAHMQAHQVRQQEMSSARTTAGQGVRQKAAAPSAAEVGQGGMTRGMDVQGAAMNQGPGSQAAAG